MKTFTDEGLIDAIIDDIDKLIAEQWSDHCQREEVFDEAYDRALKEFNRLLTRKLIQHLCNWI